MSHMNTHVKLRNSIWERDIFNEELENKRQMYGSQSTEKLLSQGLWGTIFIDAIAVFVSDKSLMKVKYHLLEIH